MNHSLQLYLCALVLVALQVLAAMPWILVVVMEPEEGKFWLRKFSSQLMFLGAVLLGGGALALLQGYIQDRNTLENWGGVYGAVLQAQLVLDFIIMLLWLLLNVWPKGAAVALAAFRESLRQPMFWLLFALAALLLFIAPVVPYFTFGEDLLMMKELSYDTIVFFAWLFAVLAASMSISDEIEGRTAITLLSKPVSRRQFLLGKFVGIFLAGLFMIGLLGLQFNGEARFMAWFNKLDATPTPVFIERAVNSLMQPGAGAAFLRGCFLWLRDAMEILPGLVLCACQVMILLALAVALATRVNMIINLVICVTVYLLGHLGPVLAEVTAKRLHYSPDDNGVRLVSFVAKLLNSALPGFEFFRVGPVLVTDAPPTMGEYYGYVCTMVLPYAALYSSMLLLVGLLAFEERDLA